MPRIGLYFNAVNRNHYLLAKTLVLGGCSIWVRSEIAPGDRRWNAPGPAEREHYGRLFSDNQIQVITDTAMAPPVDALLYEIGHDRPQHPHELHAWMGKAGRVVAFNTTDQSQNRWQNLRAEIATTVKFRKFLTRTDTVIMQAGSPSFRPTAFMRTANRFGYFVYPGFLGDPDLRSAMFDLAFDPNSPRPVRLMFAGNIAPPERTRVLQEIEVLLEQCSNVVAIRHYEGLPSRVNDEEKLVLWMPRSRDDLQWQRLPEVIPPSKLPTVLRLCDFSLCPAGYEPKTHRVLESMLQGTIPILDCPDEYDFDLRDNKNCLIVRNGAWVVTVRRALDMGERHIRDMRQEVDRLARSRLHYERDCDAWLEKLGIRVPASHMRTAANV